MGNITHISDNKPYSYEFNKVGDLFEFHFLLSFIFCIFESCEDVLWNMDFKNLLREIRKKTILARL